MLPGSSVTGSSADAAVGGPVAGPGQGRVVPGGAGLVGDRVGGGGWSGPRFGVDRPRVGRDRPGGASPGAGSGSAAAGEPVRPAPAGTGSRASPSSCSMSAGPASASVGGLELVVHPVVGEQGGFLVRAELVVEVDPGGVLDVALLVGDLEAVADLGGVDQGDERLGGAEQAGVDQRPGRVAGLAVQVELADGPHRAAVSVDDRERPPAVEGRRVEGRHARPPCYRQSAPFGDAHPHCPPSGSA